MTLAELISNFRREHNFSQRQMAARCGLSTGYISLIEKEVNPQTGKPMVPTLAVLNKIAQGMGMTIDDLISSCDDMPVDLTVKPNLLSLPTMRRIPLIGTIACGTPITADENLEGSVDLPEHIRADFALRCRGDSMINARIFDGDIVYIRQQDTVDSGEIAAVLIDDEATLKRVRIYSDHLTLEPENPLYRPLSFWDEDMNRIRILGKAVAFTSCIT